jgi:hypothetical protein
MNRRGFLGSIFVLGAAPAIVRASSLMPVRCRYQSLPPGFQFVQELSGNVAYEFWYFAENCHIPPGRKLADLPKMPESVAFVEDTGWHRPDGWTRFKVDKSFSTDVLNVQRIDPLCRWKNVDKVWLRPNPEL